VWRGQWVRRGGERRVALLDLCELEESDRMDDEMCVGPTYTLDVAPKYSRFLIESSFSQRGPEIHRQENNRKSATPIRFTVYLAIILRSKFSSVRFIRAFLGCCLNLLHIH
jgi:hypothetical protein